MAIKLDAEDLKPILEAAGIGAPPENTVAAPPPMMPQAPPAPPPPTPASAGYAAYAADPQNAAKVANSVVKPGQPVIPPSAGTAALQAGQIATHSPADPSMPPPVIPGPVGMPNPVPNVSPTPMQTYDAWAAANPGQVAKPTFQHQSGGGAGAYIRDALNIAAAGATGAAGGLHGDPSAGVNYVASRVAADRAVPEVNQQRYQAAVVQPAKDAAQIQDTQSQSAQRTAQEHRADAQAQHLLDNPEKPGDPSKTVDTADGIKQFNPDTGRFDITVGGSKEKAVKSEDQPLGPQAAHMNGVWDGVAKKHGLPTGQFTPDMTRAEAKELTQSYNNVLAAGRGDTHITIQQAGQAQRATLALTRGGPIDLSAPESKEAIASAARGETALNELLPRGATFGQRASVIAAIKAINPDYNSGDHAIENDVRRYMTSGAGGTTLTAGTTLTHHLDLYDKAVDAVHNGDIKAINHIGNEFGIQMGNDAQTNLALIRQGVAMEAARFYTGGVPGEKEIDHFEQSLSGDGSPAQMHNGATTVRGMAKGKLEGLKGQATAGAKGQPNFSGAAPTGAKQWNAKTGRYE